MPSGFAQDLSSVPLFPLPNVVLLPRAVLPLHIFEQRYRDMMRDALKGNRQFAMALLRPGWEKSYHGRAEIEPVVCVGRILSHEQLADGRFNLLLQGQIRARIVRELQTDTLYRVAELEEIACPEVPEMDLTDTRGRMIELFSTPPLADTGIGEQFLKLLQSHMTIPEIADLAVFTFIEDITLKQSLLAESDARRRVSQVMRALECLRPLLITPARHAQSSDN